ncbi:MAG: hypothetical protein ACREKH_01795 [Candidatus Rokuibacteriota bacterium]
MAFLESRNAKRRRERIRALTPAALELSDLLAEMDEAPRVTASEAKRQRVAELARLVLKEAEDLRWDPRISEEFREVLAHTTARLQDDPRVREVLGDTPRPRQP